MNPRERVLTALNHQTPDRVPLHAEFVRTILQKLSSELNCKKEEVGITLGNDVILLKPLTLYPAAATEALETFQDEWGIVWKKVGNYYERTNFPLNTMDNFDAYTFPDPFAPHRFEGMEETIKQYQKNYVIIGNAVITIFERAWWLRGMEKFMEDMLLNKDYANALLDKTLNFNLRASKKLVEMGVEMIWFGDDVGMQTRMLISPEMWREFLKPRYAKLIHEVKSMQPNLFVAYHSDGYIEPIIDELIEIGVDILNPIQPQCMEPTKIKQKYGKKLNFWGTIDVQQTLPFGTTKDVRQEVELRIKTVGRDGGLILGPAHYIQADVPLENIYAFYKAAKEYKY